MALFGKQRKQLPLGVYKLMLIVSALIWGLAFVVMKDTLTSVPPGYLLGIRFFATGLILAVIFLGRLRRAFNREHVLYGVLLGVMLFAAFWMQTHGLSDTTPGKNAFLTASYVVFVPLIYWLVGRKRPSVYNFLAAVICIVGIAFVTLQNSITMELGDIVTIVGAVLFGIHMVFVARWSQERDILVLTVYQFLSAGVCGLVCGALFETFPPLSVLSDPNFLINIVYLVVFASCLALVFQNVALAHVAPAQVSLFLSLEAVFGVVFSVALYGETLSLQLLAGFTLIFAAIVISELFPLKRPLNQKKEMPERAREKSPVKETLGVLDPESENALLISKEPALKQGGQNVR